MAEKIPAKGQWEGGTGGPEYPGRRPMPGDEVYGRKQGEALGDAEFGIAVAPYMDPEDRHLIDPAKAKLIGLTAPSMTSAINVPPMEGKYRRKISKNLHPEGKDELVLEPNNIYAMHAQDAQPTTWAHEYRHNSPKLDKKLNEELYNRYEDEYHALTEFDKTTSHEFLRDVMIRKIQNNPDAPEFASITTVRDLDELINKVKPALRQEMQTWHDNDRQGYSKHLSALIEEHLENEANGPPDERKKPMEDAE